FLAAGALDDAGGEAVAGDHRAALGDHDVDASLLEPGTVENAEAGALAARARDPALAEGVITADVQGQVLRHARAPLLEEFHQSAEVIGMAVTDDQGLDLVGLDAEDVQVVHERAGRP